MSHKTGGYEPSGPHNSFLALASHIEAVTGMRPHTCPWRSFYDPLVRAVMDAVTDASGGYGAPLDGDSPGVLWDALRVYTRAKAATVADEIKRREAEAKRKQQR